MNCNGTVSCFTGFLYAKLIFFFALYSSKPPILRSTPNDFPPLLRKPPTWPRCRGIRCLVGRCRSWGTYACRSFAYPLLKLILAHFWLQFLKIFVKDSVPCQNLYSRLLLALSYVIDFYLSNFFTSRTMLRRIKKLKISI